MIVLMKSDKTLVKTVDSRLYQKENAVDNITIYIPTTYNEYDLSSFITTLYYSNAGNNAYTDILNQLESDKEGFLEFKLPVDTKFTDVVGTVTFYLSLTKYDPETQKQYVLHSSVCSVSIEEWPDYFKFYPDESLSAIDAKILELQNETEKLKSIADELELTVPDDLKLEEDMLHLSKDGVAFPGGVEILVPGDEDHEDEAHDGVIDLDDLQGLTFVEL